MFIRAYLRASTHEQDASRAREELHAFSHQRGWTIASWYVENESGATLDRPELFRLLADCHPGDVLLIEQVDRLSRLSTAHWNELKAKLQERQVRVVALDLPTSWMMVASAQDEIQKRIFDAINAMMLDVLAAVARKDYDTRRHRQAQGIAKAKALRAYKGRPEDAARNASIKKMLKNGQTWDSIVSATRCSRSHLSRLKKQMDAEEKAEAAGA